MLKKKFLGLFNKSNEITSDKAVPQAAEQPVISDSQISSLENLSDGIENEPQENPEDIISKLAQINSIIGEEEAEEEVELESLVANSEELADAEQAEPEIEQAPPMDENSIAVDAAAILKHFPPETLVSSLEEINRHYQNDQNFAFTFAKPDIMYGLSIGSVAFKIRELANKLHVNVFDQGISNFYDQEVEIPLDEIVPLVPPSWFATQEQDCSRDEMVGEMEDLFPPLPKDTVEEKVEEEEEISSVEVTSSDSNLSSEVQNQAQEPSSIEESKHEIQESEQVSEEEFKEQDTSDIAASSDVDNQSHEEVIHEDKVQEPATNVDLKDLQEPEQQEIQYIPETMTTAADSVEESAEIERDNEPLVKPIIRDSGLQPKDQTSESQSLAQPPSSMSPPKVVEIKSPAQTEDVDADEVRDIAAEVFKFKGEDSHTLIKDSILEQASAKKSETEDTWRSQAPNGIDINSSSVSELVLLNGVGEYLAQVIIDHRKEFGPFKDLRDLQNVPGLGKRTYRTITRLSPSADLGTAERNVNRIFGITSEYVSLNQISQCALDLLDLDGIFISSVDGLILSKATQDDKIVRLADSLSAVAPQLYKRSSKALKQGMLPSADMIAFYFQKKSVSFAGSDQLFIVFIHRSDYPNQKILRQCKKIASELVWFCSYRAVIS